MASGSIFRRLVAGKKQKTWTLQYRAPVEDGDPQRQKGGFKTKAEAEAVMAAIMTAINKGQYVDPPKKRMPIGEYIRYWTEGQYLKQRKRIEIKTFGEYVEFWLDTYAKPSVSHQTFSNYRTRLLPVLRSELANRKLQDLTALELQEFFKEQSEALATTTVRHTFSLVNSVLHQAVETELLLRNPMGKVKKPKQPQQEVDILTPEEIRLYLERTKNSPLYELFYLALMTGMRRGEILGLRWQDIDFDRGNLSIYQTVKCVPGEGAVVSRSTKTNSSRRTIALSPDTLQMLKKLKVKQAKHKLALGSAYEENDLVFANEFGKPRTPTAISQQFRIYATSINLHHVHFHSLRHTHASLLLAQGENPKLISERLGHKDASMTLNVYSHLLPNAQEHAAKRLDNFLEIRQSNL